MAQRTKTIQVEWPELFGEIGPIETDQPVRVRVNREVIPIVFVPGIMGSRLKRTYAGPKGTKGEDIGMAWDPQIEGPVWSRYNWLISHFRNESPDSRKSQLVGVRFNPKYLDVIGRTPAGDVDLADQDHSTFSDDVPGAFERGWAGVSMTSYGVGLRALTNWPWSEPVRHCFDLPVHAYGYNWSDSNDASGAKLARYLSRVVDGYVEDGRVCERVILVTHSMGGLVARAACHKLAETDPDLVLGVVHGVQPASGAPSAYWRMKAGFPTSGSIPDNVTAQILGRNAADMTAVLGHMPGALQLLPNKRYQALWEDVPSPQWLRFRDPTTDVVVSLPREDPYAEIYLETNKFYRLCDRRLLDPRNRIGPNNRLGDPWWHYERHISEAKRYHDLYQGYAHPNTVQFYGDMVETVTRIVYDRTDDVDWGGDPPGWWERRKRRRGESEGPTENDEEANTHGARIRITHNLLPTDDAVVPVGPEPYPDVSPETYQGLVSLMTLRDADGHGDGTVPQTSGRVLTVSETVRIGPDEEPTEEGREHEPIYKSGTAQHIAAAAIENLCLGLIREQAGRP